MVPSNPFWEVEVMVPGAPLVTVFVGGIAESVPESFMEALLRVREPCAWCARTDASAGALDVRHGEKVEARAGPVRQVQG